MHNIHLRDLVEEHELCHGESLVKNFDFLRTYPRYKVRRVREEDSSGQYRLITNDFVDVVKLDRL